MAIWGSILLYLLCAYMYTNLEEQPNMLGVMAATLFTSPGMATLALAVALPILWDYGAQYANTWLRPSDANILRVSACTVRVCGVWCVR